MGGSPPTTARTRTGAALGRAATTTTIRRVALGSRTRTSIPPAAAGAAIATGFPPTTARTRSGAAPGRAATTTTIRQVARGRLKRRILRCKASRIAHFPHRRIGKLVYSTQERLRPRLLPARSARESVQRAWYVDDRGTLQMHISVLR